MSEIIIAQYQDSPTSIVLQTSKGKNIENQQYKMIVQQEIDTHLQMEVEFGGAKFQGEATKVYNCHGFTFASRRTGIYSDAMVNLILNDEYREIKRHEDVIVGDIVVYYKEHGIDHSAIVVEKCSNPLGFKVLSKTRPYKEIVHWVHFSPHGSNYRFYRINHANPQVVI